MTALVSATTSSSTTDLVARPGSHRVTFSGDRATVHDLELFVGWDNRIDDAGDKKIRKYDRDGISRVVRQTQEFIKRGQHPQLIPGHNGDDDAEHKPAIGTFMSIRGRDINGVPGIVGDVEMRVSDFEHYLKSNAYPRRSAEIWPDGYMSEVALLGSETPARPLPDTHFGRAESQATAERFSRQFAPAQFQTEAHPGPGNTYIPDNSDNKKKGKSMADDDKKTDDGNDDLEKMKAKLKAAEDECKDLKAKLAKYQEEDDDKKEENRKLGGEVEKFRREVETLTERNVNLAKDVTREKFTRLLEKDQRAGYPVSGENFSKVLDHILDASKPQAEYDFIKSTWSRSVPVNVTVDQDGVVVGESPETTEKHARAQKAATKRCTTEGKPENYARYFDEELEKE